MSLKEQEDFSRQLRGKDDESLESRARWHAWLYLEDSSLSENVWKRDASQEECRRRGKPELHERAERLATGVSTQLQRILSSPEFRRKELLGRILSYIVKKTIQGEKPKEISLAVDGLGKHH